MSMTNSTRPFSILYDEHKVPSWVWWGVWLVLMVLGTWGVLQRVIHGHLPAGYGSYVPWGLWVAIYFHCVGIAGGTMLVGAGGFVLDLPGFRSRRLLRMTIVLSAASIACGLMGVWFDLGHMLRAYTIYTHATFTSMMAFNSWMYTAFCITAGIAFFLSYRRNRSDWLKPLLCLAILFAILFPSQSGAFFGVVDAKPFWNSALLPVMFLISAITAGSALLLVIRETLRPTDDPDTPDEHDAALRTLRIVVVSGLIAYFVSEFAELSIAYWNPTVHAPAVELILFGPYWWVFWIIHLLIGGLIPLIFLSTQSRGLWVVAGFLVAVTFISTRLNVLVPGQAVGEIRGLQEAFHDDRLKYVYHATLMEYLVGFFIVAIGMMLFWIGQRINGRLTHRAETSG
ncbi:MAG: polysulfide reductase [Phycisphaerae bacterium]|jgi:molybdopterin-containing oxidoreductase family membrane subunit|nr:MAG: polysulfide reductase [Phycisphaerae bacterium]